MENNTKNRQEFSFESLNLDKQEHIRALEANAFAGKYESTLRYLHRYKNSEGTEKVLTGRLAGTGIVKGTGKGRGRIGTAKGHNEKIIRVPQVKLSDGTWGPAWMLNAEISSVGYPKGKGKGK